MGVGRSPRKDRQRARARWQVRAPAQKPRVVVVGFGRTGGALALGLKRAAWTVSVLPRSDDSVRRAAQLNLPLADLEALRAATLCVLAVPDSAVENTAATIRADLGPGAALVHCAGALDLSAFGAADPDRPRGSFHPLCAISDPLDDLGGHAVAIASSEAQLKATLWRMALALRLKPFEVPEAGRAAYHAGAVLSAGLVVALTAAACDALAEAGIDQAQALPALLPLIRSALRGVEARGLARGLTGPVARGDLAVVRSHLQALPANVAAIYRALSLRSLELAGDRLPKETRHALEQVLLSPSLR